MHVTNEMKEMARQYIDACVNNSNAVATSRAASDRAAETVAVRNKAQKAFLEVLYGGAPAAQYITMDTDTALVMAKLVLANEPVAYRGPEAKPFA